MRLRLPTVAVFIVLATVAYAVAAPADTKESLQTVVARMDKAANDFKAMTAHVTYVTHTDVLNEDNTETGTVSMKKVQAGEVQGLVNFASPDQYTVKFEKRLVQVYRPKIKQLEKYDLDKYSEQVDRFLMIGFGFSGTELAKDYDMAVIGSEQGRAGKGTIRLQLLPKSSDVRQYVKSIELWIPEQGDPYPESEKILLNSGDYKVITYSDLSINPALKSDALQLKTPPGVKTVFPGK
jgi:outer membrane lipoprotein-sorting protein